MTPRSLNPAIVRRAAFTTAEILVSMALLVIVMAALGSIFRISSEASNRTVAHADLLDGAAVFRQQVSSELENIHPGFLAIYSPAPTGARRETPQSSPRERIFRQRHDRLVFITTGAPDAFQSYTDPRHATPAMPDLRPVAANEALVYWGPGNPVVGQQLQRYDLDAVQLTAAEWAFIHRKILLVNDPRVTSVPGVWEPADMLEFTAAGGMLNGGGLWDRFREGRMDAVISDNTARANARSIVELINAIPTNNLLRANSDIRALWEPGFAPITASYSQANLRDYYRKHGFNFQYGMADFRIEWTDGRPVIDNGVTIDPSYETRWFGLRPGDLTDAVSPADADNIRYYAARRADVTTGTTLEEEGAFARKIEWTNHPNGAVATDTEYLAVWRADTWKYRPKALRFTYRLYDRGNRLKHTEELDIDEDGIPEKEGGDRVVVTRFGQEFSIVVPLP